MTKKVLMVCMGNICRSPIAEAVMTEAALQKGVADEWFIDSAGLVGYHSGSLPDERALSVLEHHQIKYNKVARVVTLKDFSEFDYIFGMDADNVAELKKIAPARATAKILLLGDFGLDPHDKIIYDPYYLIGEQPFENVYQQCLLASQAFLQMHFNS